MLKSYEEEFLVIENSMNTGTNVITIGPNEINDMVKELLSLPINGEQLKQIMEMGLVSRNRRRPTYTETHFSSKKYSEKLTKKNLKQSADHNRYQH